MSAGRGIPGWHRRPPCRTRRRGLSRPPVRSGRAARPSPPPEPERSPHAVTGDLVEAEETVREAQARARASPRRGKPTAEGDPAS